MGNVYQAIKNGEYEKKINILTPEDIEKWGVCIYSLYRYK